MGFPLQSIAPLVQPYTVSGADALIAFSSPDQLHDPTERTVAASEDVRQTQRKDHSVKPTKRSPLSRLCSTRESVAAAGGLDRREPVALLGFRPSRVFSRPDVSPAFTEPPLMWLTAWAQATVLLHYRVFPTGR